MGIIQTKPLKGREFQFIYFKSGNLKTIQFWIQLFNKKFRNHFFYLHLTWLCASWLIKEFWKNDNVWKYDRWFSSEVSNCVARPFCSHLLAVISFHQMVFCYQNCSDLLWEKIVLVIEKKICKNFEITWTICSDSVRSKQFLVTECFLNLFLEVSQIY